MDKTHSSLTIDDFLSYKDPKIIRWIHGLSFEDQLYVARLRKGNEILYHRSWNEEAANGHLPRVFHNI